jgi:hypothetical protein
MTLGAVTGQGREAVIQIFVRRLTAAENQRCGRERPESETAPVHSEFHEYQ